jgi:energy-converting hydrogenase A subunit R
VSLTPIAADSLKVFVSDCEGPISKNDNAFELASQFVPAGNRLFTLISRYDDVLADIVKRDGYKAGDTLRLILPFLKAYGVTNESITNYSSENILLVQGAKEMLNFVKGFMPAFIVSTSYEYYMHALCRVIDFPFQNVYCTRLDLDKYGLNDEEKKKLIALREEMINLPIPEIPASAQSLEDFPEKLQRALRRLDEIFWKEISSMEIGRVFTEVSPVGGSEKAAAVKDIVVRLRNDLQNVMYVGDSITDVEAFRLVRNGGGLTVSFNGNGFAVREAEVAVLSENAVVTALLADVFNRFGKHQVMNLIREWEPSIVDKFGLYQPLKRSLFKLDRKRFPRVELVTEQNIVRLMQESTAFRKSVRGEAIGKLG